MYIDYIANMSIVMCQLTLAISHMSIDLCLISHVSTDLGLISHVSSDLDLISHVSTDLCLLSYVSTDLGLIYKCAYACSGILIFLVSDLTLELC